MKLDLKTGIILLGILLVINRLFIDKKPPPDGSGSDGDQGGGVRGTATNRKFTTSQLQNSFEEVKKAFGSKIAKETEQLFRKETRNFDSGQFRKTFTPGMEAVKGTTSFPWGWSSLYKFLELYPQYGGKFYTVTLTENRTGRKKRFIGFPSLEGAVMFTAYTINKRPHAGHWRSRDTAIADRYYASMKKFPTKFT